MAPLRKGPRHSIFKARRAQPGREQTRQQERGNNERRPSRGVVNHGCIKSRRRKSRESGGTICRGQEWGGFFSLPRHNLLAKLVHEGCWSVFVARGEELKRTTTLHFEFSLSPSALSSLSLLAPRISLPFNFFLSDFAPPPPLSSGLHCGSLLRSFQSSLDHRGRGGSPLPLQPFPSRFLLLPFPPPPLSPLFENFSKSSFSREFAPIHNLSSRGGKT